MNTIIYLQWSYKNRNAIATAIYQKILSDLKLNKPIVGEEWKDESPFLEFPAKTEIMIGKTSHTFGDDDYWPSLETEMNLKQDDEQLSKQTVW